MDNLRSHFLARICTLVQNKFYFISGSECAHAEMSNICTMWKGFLAHTWARETNAVHQHKHTVQAPRLYNFFSCSTQIGMKFVLLINLDLLTIANYFLLDIAEHEHFSPNKYKNAT